MRHLAIQQRDLLNIACAGEQNGAIDHIEGQTTAAHHKVKALEMKHTTHTMTRRRH